MTNPFERLVDEIAEAAPQDLKLQHDDLSHQLGNIFTLRHFVALEEGWTKNERPLSLLDMEAFLSDQSSGTIFLEVCYRGGMLVLTRYGEIVADAIVGGCPDWRMPVF